ncbi:MAG TPA: hypothetical protein VG406_08230 [Isosphaeraceae bacterium]|jgi:hypothetical protein|nr:hypothetical protein [Isosphaeraceae bacterium]
MQSARSRAAVACALGLVAVASAAATAGAGDDDPRTAEAKAAAKAAAIHDDFEGPRVAWRREATDAGVVPRAHDRTDRARHDGLRSERIAFEAQGGSAVYYSYPLPKVPVTPDLTVRLYVRANQPGIDLAARVVLPADTDPDTGQPSFVTVPGVRTDASDRWQKLVLADLPLAVERQARILRIKTKREVKIEGAYLDRLVLNALGGPGASEVFVDDLTIAPVPEALAAIKPDATEPTPGTAPPKPPATAVALERNRLSRDGRPWTFSAIDAPGADVRALRQSGFDVLVLPEGTGPELAREAASAGFLLMPRLALYDRDAPRDPAAVVADAASFPERKAVAFWDLGDGLGAEPDLDARNAALERVRSIVLDLHAQGPGEPRLATGGVAGLIPGYALIGNGLDLVGVGPLPWGTTLEPSQYRAYLEQRRILAALANPQALFWTTIPLSPPEEVTRAIWGDDRPPPWGRPRLQPEQVRLFVFAALAAGYRGLAFRGDATLTAPQGRMLLLELELLNDELRLIGPAVALGKDPIRLVETFPPDPPRVLSRSGLSSGVRLGKPKKKGQTNPGQPMDGSELPPLPSIRAASIATPDRRGQLLLFADYAPGAQWQPPQMAFSNLTFNLPGALMDAQGFEVSPGGVRVFDTKERERMAGGLHMIMPDFGPTAIVLVTTDPILPRIEAATAAIRSRAILNAIEQARLEYEFVLDTHRRLVADGHDVRYSADLLADAAEKLKAAREAIEREDYLLAWQKARHVGRPLRFLMRAHWDLAVDDLCHAVDRRPPAVDKESTLKNINDPNNKPEAPTRDKYLNPLFKTPDKYRPADGRPAPWPLVSPVAAAPLVAFNTLPQQYIWNFYIRTKHFGPDLLPGGSFEKAESVDALKSAGWSVGGYAVDGVVGRANVADGGWKGSKRMVRLSVRLDQSDGNFAPAAPPRGRKPDAGQVERDRVDAVAPYLDRPVVSLTSPPVSVAARQFVRISVNVKVPRPQPQGGGGVVIRDSLGGEPLQFRITEAIPDWRRVYLYRRVPADGELTVTLGLAGFGEALFDDLRIDRIEAEPDAPSDLARRRPRTPSAALPRRPAPPRR